VAPQASVARATPLRVAPDVAVDAVQAAQPQLNQMLLAASESDFGGYFFPVVGLTLLGAIITYLSPPLKDE